MVSEVVRKLVNELSWLMGRELVSCWVNEWVIWAS